MRRVTENYLCPYCHSCMEDPPHALVNYRSASSSWEAHPEVFMQHEEESFAAWWDKVDACMTVEQTQVCAVVCWLIWRGRND